MLKTRELTRSDIEWIFAVKDNVVLEYYRKHYFKDPGFLPTYSLYGRIVKSILYETGTMGDAIRWLDFDWMLYTMSEKREQFTLNEIIWLAFKAWAHNMTVDKLDDLCSGDWRKWSEELRKWEESFNGN